jgi:prephenate dehydrogenase
MALRSRCPDTIISVWGRSEDRLKEVLSRGLADFVSTEPLRAVQGADLVILCTPVDSMEKIAKTMSGGLLPDSVVTDAGSVKHCVMEKMAPLFGGRFVGGHPMAGNEGSGLAAARADLFNSAPCILTPLASTDPIALQVVGAFWNSLGAEITTMSPEEHDRLVAYISHLPHALAFALVNLAKRSLPDGSLRLAGGSFRDATRVSASNPDLWTGILMENRREVIPALREMSGLLNSLADRLDHEHIDSLLDFFARAKEDRDSLSIPFHNRLL